MEYVEKARIRLKKSEDFVKSISYKSIFLNSSGSILLSVSCLSQAYFDFLDPCSDIRSDNIEKRTAAAEEILGEYFFLGGDFSLPICCEINGMECGKDVYSNDGL